MRDLQWEGNSKKMYEAILREIPFMFAGNVKKNINRWIEKNDVHIVTEDIIFKAVEEIAPAGLAEKRIKPGLEKLRTR